MFALSEEGVSKRDEVIAHYRRRGRGGGGHRKSTVLISPGRGLQMGGPGRETCKGEKGVTRKGREVNEISKVVATKGEEAQTGGRSDESAHMQILHLGLKCGASGHPGEQGRSLTTWTIQTR